jgi:hypothetical protein
MCQVFRLQRFRLKISAARTVPPPHDRRTITSHRGSLRPRPPPWPSNIIGPPCPGDHRTPVERWQDWCFEWEGHFYSYLDEVMDPPDPPPPVRAILCLIGSPEDDHEGQLELRAWSDASLEEKAVTARIELCQSA